MHNYYVHVTSVCSVQFMKVSTCSLTHTQSKAYAKAQGLPTTWSQEDQGYIARWYSYYTAEGYETGSSRPGIRKVLIAIFILLNLFVLHANITVGRKWYYRFYNILKESSEQASRIYRAAGITMAAFNFLYLTTTVVLYTKYDIPPIHRAKCTTLADSECSPPHTSTLYKDEVTSFIVKVVVLLIAIITALLVAIKSTMKSTLPTVGRCSKFLRYAWIILLWNYFVFVQIWAGLASLPLCIFLIISPLQNLSILCAVVLFILLIAMSVACLLQLGDIQMRTCNYKSNSKVCAHFSRWSIVLPLSLTLATLYFLLSPSTGELSSVRKVLFSLLPPLVLSVLAWVVKRRFLKKNTHMEKQKKTERQLSVQSISTEEDYLQDTENGNLEGSDEEQRSLLTEALVNSDISDIV